MTPEVKLASADADGSRRFRRLSPTMTKGNADCLPKDDEWIGRGGCDDESRSVIDDEERGEDSSQQWMRRPNDAEAASVDHDDEGRWAPGVNPAKYVPG